MNKDTLKKLHEVQLDILDEIIRLCEKHHLTYYLAGGSVLGAVRHQGFIPWDDDIDVAMPRVDYEQFAKICENALNKAYFYQSSENDAEYTKVFAKIRKNNTVMLEEFFSKTNQNNGIFVDIFPLDTAKRESGIQMLQYKLLNKFGGLLNIKLGIRKKGKTSEFIARLFTVKFLKKAKRFCMVACNRPGNMYYVNFGSQYGVKKQTMRKEIYDPPAKLSFEGRECAVPGNYTQFLANLYGEDYMKLPPKEKQRTHNPIRLSFDTTGPDEDIGDFT